MTSDSVNTDEDDRMMSDYGLSLVCAPLSHVVDALVRSQDCFCDLPQHLTVHDRHQKAPSCRRLVLPLPQWMIRLHSLDGSSVSRHGASMKTSSQTSLNSGYNNVSWPVAHHCCAATGDDDEARTFSDTANRRPHMKTVSHECGASSHAAPGSSTT